MINLTLSHLRSQELPSFPHVSTASYNRRSLSFDIRSLIVFFKFWLPAYCLGNLSIFWPLLKVKGYMYAKKSLEKTTCVTKIIYYIFMQKCSKICKNLFHYAKRKEVCTFHDLNSSIPLSHKIEHSIQKKDILYSRYMYPALRKCLSFVWLCGWTPI